MDLGLGDVKTLVDTIRSIIATWREVKDELPDGPKKEAVSRSLQAAERQSKVAEAQIAAALGYPLCRCEFPPTIMLRVGSKRGRDQYKCNRCERLHPPDELFDALDREEANAEPSWIDVRR